MPRRQPLTLDFSDVDAMNCARPRYVSIFRSAWLRSRSSGRMSNSGPPLCVRSTEGLGVARDRNANANHSFTFYNDFAQMGRGSGGTSWRIPAAVAGQIDKNWDCGSPPPVLGIVGVDRTTGNQPHSRAAPSPPLRPRPLRLPFTADDQWPIGLRVEYAYCVVDYQCGRHEETLSVAASPPPMLGRIIRVPGLIAALRTGSGRPAASDPL